MIRMWMFKSYLSCANCKLFPQICLFLLQWLRQRTRKLSWLLKKLYCTSRPREWLKQKKNNIAEKYRNVQNVLTKGPVKNDVAGVKGRGYPKLVTKNGIWGRGSHVNSYITTKENYVLSFYFLLVFSQRGSGWAFVNSRVVVSFQALVWVRVPRLTKHNLHLVKSASFSWECL